jgi:hypothetical protein
LVEDGTGAGRVGKLDFTGFGVTALADAVGRLDRLYYLDLGLNKLTWVPDTIGWLGDLKVLRLHKNHLQSVPETVGQLRRLRDLYFSITTSDFRPFPLRY